nr:MAG TPA: hypothetical protein [Bacteriophage sp.]
MGVYSIIYGCYLFFDRLSIYNMSILIILY